MGFLKKWTIPSQEMTTNSKLPFFSHMEHLQMNALKIFYFKGPFSP